MTYSWLVENFTKDGKSTGLYMACQVNMTVTADVNAARKFRRQITAEFRALDMREARRGDWRAVEHGFLPSPEPAPQAEPSRSQKMREAGFMPRDTRLTCDECGAKFTRQFAPLHECAPQAEPATVGELPPLTDEQIAFCIFEARMEAGTFKRDGTMSFRIARAVEREVRAAIASAPHAREPLNFDRLQSVMAAHFGGRELTDDEADSAEAFARAIERAHGIG